MAREAEALDHLDNEVGRIGSGDEEHYVMCSRKRAQMKTFAVLILSFKLTTTSALTSHKFVVAVLAATLCHSYQ